MYKKHLLATMILLMPWQIAHSGDFPAVNQIQPTTAVVTSAAQDAAIAGAIASSTAAAVAAGAAAASAAGAAAGAAAGGSASSSISVSNSSSGSAEFSISTGGLTIPISATQNSNGSITVTYADGSTATYN